MARKSAVPTENQLSGVQRVRFHRSDHAAHSRQALLDGALLRLVLQQDAQPAQEACGGGTGGGRVRVLCSNSLGHPCFHATLMETRRALPVRHFVLPHRHRIDEGEERICGHRRTNIKFHSTVFTNEPHPKRWR